MYATYSDLFWFMSPKTLAPTYQIMDVLLYRILMDLDRNRYRPKEKPSWLAWRGIARAAWGILWATRRMWWNSAVAFVSPARYLKRYREATLRFETDARSARPDASVAELHALVEVRCVLKSEIRYVYRPYGRALLGKEASVLSFSAAHV